MIEPKRHSRAALALAATRRARRASGQFDSLDEEVGEGVEVGLAEVADGAGVGAVVADDGEEGGVAFAGEGDLAGGEDADAVGVDEQSEEHGGVEGDAPRFSRS